MPSDPRDAHPRPPFEAQPQPFPGSTAAMRPEPDHGETSYVGSGRLAGRKALVTGADSGIGRAVAIAFAREGADVAISYLEAERDDAEATLGHVTGAGRRGLLLPGDISDPGLCELIVDRTAAELGGIDILVNNAAFQRVRNSLDEITDEEWNRTWRTNVDPLFYLSRRAVRHMPAGGAIVNTSSVNAKHPMPSLLAYSATKAAIANLTLGMAQMLAPKGIRVNAVLPGPIWTPFIVTGMEPSSQEHFGGAVPFARPGQPAELASAYVMLASDESSFTSGALVAVAGGMPVF